MRASKRGPADRAIAQGLGVTPSAPLGGIRYSIREQSIGGTVKPLVRTSRVTEMTDQFTGRAVDVDPFEIIKLLAGRIENLRADHDADEHALTVEYVAAHGRPPCPSAPSRTLRSLVRNSERNRNAGPTLIPGGSPWIRSNRSV